MFSRRNRLNGSLVAAMGLTGMSACGGNAEPPRDTEATIGSVGESLVSNLNPRLSQGLAKCLSTTELRIDHEDGSRVYVTSNLHDGLSTKVRPGDRVDVDFALTPECIASFGRQRLTLASYTSNKGVTYGPGADPPAQIYDVDTRRFGTGTNRLSIHVPKCAYEVVFAFGEPIQKQSETMYESEQRLIASGHAGGLKCWNVPALSIQQFDTVDQAWGDAPVAATFGWKIESTNARVLKCRLDLDGDGEAEQDVDPCPVDTSGVEKKELPSFDFTKPGKYRPEMFVFEGNRRIWGASTVYSNHLEFKPNVHFPEKALGFLNATFTPQDPPALSTVILKYATSLPTILVNDVVVGMSGDGGYILRATQVLQNAKTRTLTIRGIPVTLDSVISDGFFGMREVPVPMTNAHCAQGFNCIGTITPVLEPPTGPNAPLAKRLAADVSTLQQTEYKKGIKFSVPLTPEGCSEGVCVAGEAEFFAGMVIDYFEIVPGFLSIEFANVKMAPTVEVTASVRAQIAQQFEFGHYYLGTLPTPVPVSVSFEPRLDLEVNAAFKVKASAAAPFLYREDADGTHASVDPIVQATASLLESTPESSIEVETKIKAIPQIALNLGPLPGPYVAPTIAVAFKSEVKPNCEICGIVALEGGAEFGWQELWSGAGQMFGPLQVTLAELELAKRCVQGQELCPEGQPSCQDLAATCGPDGNENCCSNTVVPGGTFDRSNDPNYPATVSSFGLDRFEVTVGRFRQFVNAGNGTSVNPPAAGAGAHPLIAGSGWTSEWNQYLPQDRQTLEAAIKGSPRCTWTPNAGANENLPMNCMSWYLASAFCAWDGGRLPTEAEWNYAAAGGNEQRFFPWASGGFDVDHANYGCSADGNPYPACDLADILKVGAKSPLGDGKWGQADMAGNMYEWALDRMDWVGPYTQSTCVDCATVAPIYGDAEDYRAIRGGAFTNSYSSDLLSSTRANSGPWSGFYDVGIRCARSLAP